MAQFKKLTKRGFTLIELMIVVVIIGILASLAIYGVSKYVANSKSAEARMMLGHMSKDALSVYEGEVQAAANIVLGGQSAASNRVICANENRFIPAAVSAIQSRKYQPTAADWKPVALATDFLGFKCLGTEVLTPIYYRYSYGASTLTTANAASPAVNGDTFTLQAQGDLDGDGNLSTFRMGGTVQLDAATNDLILTLDPAVFENNAEE